MSWLSGNYEITAEASRAYNEAKGLAGEQPDDLEIDLEEPPCFSCDGIGCPDCLDEHDRDRLDDR